MGRMGKISLMDVQGLKVRRKRRGTINQKYQRYLKNLKDAKKDRELGYKTLGRNIAPTKLCFELSFLMMLAGYFMFNLTDVFLWFLLATYIVKTLISYQIDIYKHKTALNLMRLMVITFLTGMIVDFTESVMIIYISISIAGMYILLQSINYVSRQTGRS